MTDGIKWKLILFCLALGGLNLLGAIALGVGLLVTIPTSLMAYVYVYRALRDRGDVASQTENVSDPIVIPVPAPSVPAEPVVIISPESSEGK